MTVEMNKLELIASAIRDQARLLRKAGKVAQATGMEQRADELRALCGLQDCASTPVRKAA